MKKKTILIILSILFFGCLAYFSGYYLMYENAQTSRQEILEQRSLTLVNQSLGGNTAEYYLVRSEKKMLNIYKMPENILYDSINLNSLHFLEDDKERLNHGIMFESLTEVFEFLESSMS